MDILTRLAKLIVASFAAEYDNGNSGTAITIDFANGQKQKVTVNNNTTITFAAPPGVGDYKLRLLIDGTGGYTIAFAGISSSRWWGRTTAPTINNAANAETLMALYHDGTNYSQGRTNVGAADV